MPYNSNDNTKVSRPLIQEPIKYKLLPGEVKLPSGLIIKVKLEELSQGSSEPKVLRDKRYEELTRLHELQKLKEREAFTIQGLTAPLLLISPSHIIGSANSNKPFLESYLGDSYNSATGTMLGDFALDAIVGGGLWKGAKVAGDLSRAAYSRVIQPGVRFLNSPLTGKWTKFGNREYRLSPNTLGINGGSLESRNILNELPIDENRYYRLVDRDAFDSYKQTGVVSQYTPHGGLKSAYPVPMFSKGRPSSYRLGINDYNKVWLVSKPKAKLEWESVKGAAMSPKVNGEFNKAPISDFDFYVYNPEKGYIKLDESLNLPGGVTVSRTPHIDYLNSISRNEQIKYLTDNGLNDLWLWTLENNPDHLENALSKAPIPNSSKNTIYFEINPYEWKDPDFPILTKWMFSNKIMGFPSPYSYGLDDSGKVIFSSDVRKGISSEAKKYLMHNTVDRNIREFKLNGYGAGMNQTYKEKANDLFDNVNVGTFSGDDYVRAGRGDTGGFFITDRNFISINRDSRFPELFVEKHEARHLLDANTSMLDSQYKLLSEAYDDDFINIPNTQYAGSLKDYPNMHMERATTNRDARDILFGKFAPHMKFSDHHLLDMVIDRISDDKIFEAIEKANGYGRRFILFLRDSNKLTPEKAQQFREAMKHVGGIAAPVGVGTHLYNQNNVNN